MIDGYFGEAPKTFKVNGKEYTPKSYVKDISTSIRTTM